MKIATFNVNSIKARVETVLAWFKQASPDVACLQEIKCETNAFPALEFEAMGYHCAILGQKSYNGVAIISTQPLVDVRREFGDGEDDGDARVIAATSLPSGIPRRRSPTPRPIRRHRPSRRSTSR